MCVQNKILVLFLVLFWHRFGSITLKLPGAKLQLICFHMVYTCRHQFAERWQVGGLAETVFMSCKSAIAHAVGGL